MARPIPGTGGPYRVVYIALACVGAFALCAIAGLLAGLL